MGPRHRLDVDRERDCLISLESGMIDLGANRRANRQVRTIPKAGTLL